ncbi:MAG: hypothetical protein RIE24_01350 [Silicimonas sp.]
MAGTNRNRKLRLNDAWKHYWSVLFPGCNDWHADLEAEIRLRLYHPGEVTDFPSCIDPGLQPPSWANDLEFEFDDNMVAVKFRNRDFGKFPLFTDQLIPDLEDWSNKNPLAAADGAQALSDRDQDKCREFFIAVIRNCGNSIRSRLLRMIKEIKSPQFEVYCRPSDDGFAEQRMLPVSGLSEVAGLNIQDSVLTGRLGTPRYSNVQIKRTIPSTSRVGPHGSFQEQDAALVEEMKTLLDQGEVFSVRQAALAVMKQAPRRRNSSDDSILRRLQDGFSKKYPNYVNRLAQKAGPPGK